MKNNMNPPLEIDDRIVLVHMDDPFTHIPVGTKGTVLDIEYDPWSDKPVYQVKWDNGSSLRLVSDEDYWIKDDGLVKEQSEFFKDSYDILPIVKSDKDKSIIKFLKALRESGIINMYQSPDFIWGGSKYLKRYIEIERLRGDLQDLDEEVIENLSDLSDRSQSNMINAAMLYLKSRGDDEFDLNNVNRAARYLSKKAFKYYTLVF